MLLNRCPTRLSFMYNGIYKLKSCYKKFVTFKIIRLTRLKYEIVMRSHTQKNNTYKTLLQLNLSLNYILTYTHSYGETQTSKYTQTYTDTYTYTQFPKLLRIPIRINLTYNNG